MLTLLLRDGESAPTPLDAVKSPQDLQAFSHYRHEISLTHRPLEPIAPYPAEPDPVSTEGLLRWASSAESQAAQATFAQYPERSLCSTIDRALLYHLVRAMRPENIIEIGTYFAGGSEIMSRALWENGKGLLHTIDPFGAIRCPALIGRWSDQLQHHVRFYPWTSMELFQRLSEQKTPIDMAFIDGNHDFEFALFDLQSAARFMSPGGVIVMDDANQSGPFWASKVFLEQNPGWSELGNCIERAEADPFGPLPSLFPHSKFLLLQAPRGVVVGKLPYATGQVPFQNGDLQGIKLSLAPGQQGEIVGRVFLRAFPAGKTPQQHIGSFRTTLHGETERDVALNAPLRTKCADEVPLPRHSYEIVLLWRPRNAGEALRLRETPTPIVELAGEVDSPATLPMIGAAEPPRDAALRAA